MIVRPRPGLLEVLFALQGTILLQILGRIGFITVVSILAVLAAKAWPGMFAQISAVPFALIGISLSIFMSFRNSVCYERWWEARKLWGSLIIATRSLARLTATLDEADRQALLRGLCGFTMGLLARLRGGDEVAAIARWHPQGSWSTAPNPTDAVLQALGLLCLRLADAGRINPILHSQIDGQIGALAQVQASCERIATTPVPFTYSLILHRTTYVFCLVLPFALAGALGWWALLPVLLSSYTFFGLDALGDQLEDPFGLEPNDLPLDAMARTVEREMLAALGSDDLPPVLEPVDYVLT
jgi:putative membrane protein